MSQPKNPGYGQPHHAEICFSAQYDGPWDTMLTKKGALCEFTLPSMARRDWPEGTEKCRHTTNARVNGSHKLYAINIPFAYHQLLGKSGVQPD